jgi:hypothetical protein
MSLKITHSCGFFSCCSVRLSEIIGYFNSNQKLPEIVDSSEQYSWYKSPEFNNRDITYDYFENNILDEICWSDNINYYHDYQFINYKSLNYHLITPFINKYFKPTKEILEIVLQMENKYNINDYSNICVLFYRGNDKVTETELSSYEKIIEKANEILSENPNILFLIQSDETEFIEKMTNLFPNSFYFKDESRHMKKCNSTVDIIFKDFNYRYSKFYLAITIIMSKCKYVVCGSSGNCSIWIAFYRGNSDGLFQYLDGQLI